jgi:ring-1,2-phenylacetyl-CoA epoxidase subunit PaaB
MEAPVQATIRSLDPRVTRLSIPQELPEFTPKPPLDEWQTYEVFHQARPGEQPVHVGTVHAPDPEMALVFAKEQYARRGTTYSLWFVRTADIYAFRSEDADIFATVPEKTYREPHDYKVAQKLLRLKRKSHGSSAADAPASS